MIFARRNAVLFFTAILLIFLLRLRSPQYRSTLEGLSQTVGLGELIEDEEENEQGQQPVDVNNAEHNPTEQLLPHLGHADVHNITAVSSNAEDGVKPQGTSYTRALVIGRLTSENTTWLDDHLLSDPSLRPYIYIVDDQSAPFHTPRNKGHEAMPYLTYLIDHYDSLPDISIFMHPHRIAWHTPELLNHDSVELLKRLSSEHIMRLGYTNLRCHWDPGCPERIHPGRSDVDNLKREEVALAKAWAEMFPEDPIPDVIGAHCCAQFAVTRERIRSIPRKHFERYRAWLLRTQETDWISGRVFEYLWHKIFTGQARLCPDARACYCDGYGICFTSSESYETWFDNHRWWREDMKQLERWDEKANIVDRVLKEEKGTAGLERMKLDVPAPGVNWDLQKDIDERFELLVRMRTEALKNGTDPEVRARVAGRPWKEGNGY